MPPKKRSRTSSGPTSSSESSSDGSISDREHHIRRPVVSRLAGRVVSHGFAIKDLSGAVDVQAQTIASLGEKVADGIKQNASSIEELSHEILPSVKEQREAIAAVVEALNAQALEILKLGESTAEDTMRNAAEISEMSRKLSAERKEIRDERDLLKDALERLGRRLRVIEEDQMAAALVLSDDEE